MTFLIDENLSRHLVKLLASTYPNCVHVADAGLLQSDDRLVWAHAQRANLALLSKDDDFLELSQRWGPPPKVVWLRLGNLSTRAIAQEMTRRRQEVTAFLNNENSSVLEIKPE